MKAVPAVYENGQITLSAPPENAELGPVRVLVIFPEESDDPWQKILTDSRPRPALDQYLKECLDEIALGKAEPLDPEHL
ncbi:MAG TPA: hypothetical protein VKA46_20045 [Gemmataceae bacterium]|nr:hypothetical protein [Gemmataceae bacterium]